ncbi:MAG: aminopeptidase P family protein [Actinomycetota bacterium]|nr:aminopeptidase P family protein [Actinomycetota bacterium]
MTAAALAPMDTAGRLPRLRQRLAEAGCQALLVTRLANLRYLTGFTGSAGLLLVLPDEDVLVTDGRYREQAAEELARAGVELHLEIHATVAGQRDASATAAAGIGRLGLEAGDVTWAAQRRYAEEWFATSELVATEGVIEGLRERKDGGEVARLAEAARVADAALAAVRPLLGEGPAERDFGLALDGEMRRLGADDVSFETIVGSGPNGAKPHARPTGRTVAEGDLVVLDFGALVDGYHSDMTRTVMVGDPSPTQRRMLEVVAESQAAGVASVAAGTTCAEVDRACRDVIVAAGWGAHFVHGTGHGVGLDIHEDPRVSGTSAATLAPDHVVTVEPGVYLPEHGGVRIEDTVVVTAGGCRTITLAPKDPFLR